MRSALLTMGTTILALTAVTTTSAQAASWLYVGYYTSNSRCVDAGQQYQREGFSTFKCVDRGNNKYDLFVM
ncbi:hypothetical protein [Embleya sp. NBC_00896]|uniref:hypothetical protein n=1 Tax=Embleya sp. NBC_00896 TaxID=2975961 RepID=UPI002F915351|nr:hypothetical protein OG928_42450 [Embleya sp. NBC_00896]